ncbi:hypothetical protein BH23ACT3_BH23ACT3_04170 [soil metagenome]
MIGIAAVVAVALVALVLVFALGGGDDDVDSVTTNTTDDTTTTLDATATTTTVDDTTTTTVDTTTTTAVDTTTTTDEVTTTTAADDTTTTSEPGDTTTTEPGHTTTTLPGDPNENELAVTVWPWAGSDTRYSDPVEAATAFAEEYLGMTDPLVGDFMQADALSGEIEIRSLETFTPTLVALRLFGEAETWWVLGAATADIEVDEPQADAVVSSPLTVSGRSVAFEGTVQVAIRVDGDDDPVFEDFVTGGGTPGDPAPFEDTFEWDAPDTGRGQLVFYTTSSDDGRVLQATVVRITFGAAE